MREFENRSRRMGHDNDRSTLARNAQDFDLPHQPGSLPEATLRKMTGLATAYEGIAPKLGIKPQ